MLLLFRDGVRLFRPGASRCEQSQHCSWLASSWPAPSCAGRPRRVTSRTESTRRGQRTIPLRPTAPRTATTAFVEVLSKPMVSESPASTPSTFRFPFSGWSAFSPISLPIRSPISRVTAPRPALPVGETPLRSEHCSKTSAADSRSALLEGLAAAALKISDRPRTRHDPDKGSIQAALSRTSRSA
jgi:hypothetical protein